MAICEVCGNEHDKSFELTQRAHTTPSTASNAQFRPSPQAASIANAELLVMAWKWAAISSVAPIAQDPRRSEADAHDRAA